jgi:hypothetical protein
MQTLRVARHRHIFPDINKCCLRGPVRLSTRPLPFQAAEEPFYRDVIPTVIPASDGFEIFVHQADRQGTLPHSGSHSPDHSMTYITRGEDARYARFQQKWIAL